MAARTLSSPLALCVIMAVIPFASSAAPTSRDVLDFQVNTLFANCVRAVLTSDEASYAALKKEFVPASHKDPNELKARAIPGVTLHIHGPDQNACMLIAQNNAQDNRVIAEMLREKLKMANAKQDEPSKVEGGQSWLVRVPEDGEAARVTLEIVWDDTFLVIHFLDPSAPSPVPVPPIPPPPAPPPRR